LSVAYVHVPGQQPSPSVQVVSAEVEHATLQFAADPVVRSLVQALLSLHVLGQLPGGSHVSFASTVPSPHVAEQSVSVP
jgi:hypothetical protein